MNASTDKASGGGHFEQTHPIHFLYEPQQEENEPDGERPLHYSDFIILRLSQPENDDDSLPVYESLQDEALRLGYEYLVEVLDSRDIDGTRLIQAFSPKQISEFENPTRYSDQDTPPRDNSDDDRQEFEDFTSYNDQLAGEYDAEIRQQDGEQEPPSLNLYWRLDVSSLSDEEIESVVAELTHRTPGVD